jgi:hypothetical protein
LLHALKDNRDCLTINLQNGRFNKQNCFSRGRYLNCRSLGGEPFESWRWFSKSCCCSLKHQAWNYTFLLNRYILARMGTSNSYRNMHRKCFLRNRRRWFDYRYRCTSKRSRYVRRHDWKSFLIHASC